MIHDEFEPITITATIRPIRPEFVRLPDGRYALVFERFEWVDDAPTRSQEQKEKTEAWMREWYEQHVRYSIDSADQSPYKASEEEWWLDAQSMHFAKLDLIPEEPKSPDKP